jgi:penicillin-binding protein 1A
MIRRLLILFNILFVMVIAGIIGLTVRYSSVIPRLPDDLRLLASTPATEIYARDGRLLGALGARDYVSISKISPHFIHAVIAAEDKRFYHHRGVDHIAFMRAAWLNVVRKGRAPGGSSITQQLAKNLFFSFKRSWERKIVEALASIAIEQRFTKEEILETYCNLIYFGRYAYGVEKAAKLYFNKHASDLSIEEAALLAGIPNAPTRLDPHNHLEAAMDRQKVILLRMAELGYVEKTRALRLAEQPLALAPLPKTTMYGSYPMDYALETARRELGADIINYGGVKIHTSIDLAMQHMAEETVSIDVEQLENSLKPSKPGSARLEGGLVAVEVESGKILAMVGGRSYDESPFNRAIYSLRQPGSSFKPVIYLAALEYLGITPETMVEDKSVTFEIPGSASWSPKNFDEEFLGQIPLREALAKSINTIAAQLIYELGPGKVVETAARMGIKSRLEPHLSLALGAGGVTMVDMATAIATIAREGEEIDPIMVTRIDGPGGELLAEFLSMRERRFNEESCYQLITMMQGVIDHGTGTVIRRRNFTGTAIGKTGTSSDYRDSWFVGATPTLSVSTWVGYDDNRQMFLIDGRGVTGASGAAPLWADFMVLAMAGEPNREFPRPLVMTKELKAGNLDFLENQRLRRSADDFGR